MTIPLTSAEKEDIKHNITTIVELMGFYGLDTQFNTQPTQTHWETLTQNTKIETVSIAGDSPVNKSRVIVLTKYKLAAFIAHLTETPLPEAPFPKEVNDNPAVLIGGRFNIWMNKIILRTGERKENEDRKLSVIQSLIQSKGGLTKPNWEYQRFGEIKTFEKLTTPKQDDVNEDINYQIIEELKRTTREIFTKDGKPMRFNDQAKFAYSLPSSNSNYNNSRSMYGALGHLLPHVEKLNLKNKKLMRFKVTNKVNKNDDEDRIENEIQENEHEVDVIELTKAVYEFRKSVMEEAKHEEPRAIVFGLSEPAKVRVITKGPPATYYILKSLQKYMHNHMRTLPVFALLGQTVNAEIIHETISDPSHGEKILSGDYSDATNELESWVTDAITDELVDVLKISNDEKDLMYKSLTKHIMEIRDNKGKTILNEKPQVNGQLMGSILSFLWLCIANLTLVRMSKERGEGRTISLEELKARINGDDCLFNANLKVKELWELFGKAMGLKPSLGKVFWTDKFCTLNSRMFKPYNDFTVEIPFISLGLLYNIEKSTRLDEFNRSSQDFLSELQGLETIGVRNQWLMQGCPIQLRQKVQTRFIKIHRDLLDQSMLDWWMPEWSGGLGLCDVSEEGWILNATIPFPGNPKPEYDDNMKPIGLFKIFDEKRNDPERHKKSRGALRHMITNWGKNRFTPRVISSHKLPNNLDLISVCQTIFPEKPKEVLTFGGPKEIDDIYDVTFGMAVMTAYLTDDATQKKIKGELEESINASTSNRMYIDQDKITKFKGNQEISYEFKSNEKTGRKRKIAIKNFTKDVIKEEWERRIKQNRAVWKNNLKIGCTALADWKFLQRRVHRKVFKGKLIGKGLNALRDLNYGEWAPPEHGHWSKEETMEIELW
jgi:hypothetical protein